MQIFLIVLAINIIQQDIIEPLSASAGEQSPAWSSLRNHLGQGALVLAVPAVARKDGLSDYNDEDASSAAGSLSNSVDGAGGPATGINNS